MHLLLTLLFLLSSCSATRVVVDQPTSKSIIPMAVGNEWIYQVKKSGQKAVMDTVTITAIDTVDNALLVSLNGQKTWAVTVDGIHQIEYQRNGSEVWSIRYWRVKNKKEEKQTLFGGDVSTTVLGEEVDLTVPDQGVRHNYKFTLLGTTTMIHPDIGIIYENNSNRSKKLVSYTLK